ncbi:MAG: hypothetical protein IPP17_05685 [Bacteroidetes bacterium]|nr:hypothetical protein [Bacteroidota bacterium]
MDLYFKYLQGGSARLMRKATIESFERAIDDIEWDEIGSEFIYRVSAITGFVYQNETNAGKSNKARFGFKKPLPNKKFRVRLPLS